MSETRYSPHTSLTHRPQERRRGRRALRLGLALTLALVAGVCLAVPAAPASAHPGKMRWSVVDTPNSTNNVIVSPSEINGLAIGCDGRTFYAMDIAHSRVYRSMNGGITWDDASSHLAAAAATLPAWDIAMAPDNPNVVAAVTSTGGLPREVFMSTDGGATWEDTGFAAAGNIGAIDISPNRGGYDIAVGTRTGAAGGDVYVLRAAQPGAWSAQNLSGDVLAIEFSPNYATDSSLVTVSASSANATGTYLNLGIRDPVANTTHWGTWGPVEVTTAGAGTSPSAAQILTADLELPSDFSGQASTQRRMYVSTDAPGANAGIYRFDDTVAYSLMPATAGKRISSIAYHGTYASGKLLVGEVSGDATAATVMTWFTDAPTTCPRTCWYEAQKPPTGSAGSGNGNAQLTWSADGSTAYCATSSANLNPAGWPNGYLTGQALDESAFSVSTDSGRTWNQLSLIDTELTFLSDVAVSAASNVLYLASINTNAGNTGFDSVWQTASSPPGRIWERVLCLRTATDDTILRMAQAEATPTAFLGVRSTIDLLQSQDGGQTWHATHPGVNITDFAVTRADDSLQLYVLDSNLVRKGTCAGEAWRWGSEVDTYLMSGHSLTALPTGAIVVGDAGAGMVAYSSDGGEHFTRIPAIPTPGNMHVVTDARIQNYIVIYAASDSVNSEIYGRVVGASSEWTPMGTPGQSFYGLAQRGVLYGARPTATSSAVDRSLNPEEIYSTFVQWDSLTTGLANGVVFTREPVSLKVSGSVDLWAIDNRNYSWPGTRGCLWVFSDCMTMGPRPVSPPDAEVLFEPPTLITPPMDEIIPTDPDTGEIADIDFKWQHAAQATRYEVWLATDEGFTDTVVQEDVIPRSPLAPTWTLSSRTAALEPGETYYWKVRVTRAATGETGEGQWSEVMSFKVEPAPQQEAPHTGVTLLAPPDGATGIERSPSFSWTATPEANEYQLTIAGDEALEQVIASVKLPQATYDYDAPLDSGATYFWQVRVTKPFLGDPSPVSSFTVAATQDAEPQPGRAAKLPAWIWIVVGLLGSALLAVLAIAMTKPGILRVPSKRR